MSNVRDYTHRPAAQADGPPRIWGVEPEVTNTLHEWEVAGFYCDAWKSARGPWQWRVSLKGKGNADTPAEAALAIEAELTRIETEIRTAREGKK